MMAKTAAAGGPGLHPDVLAFTSSLAQDRALVREDVVGSLAHLAMLAHVGLVPAEAAAALKKGLIAIEADAALGTLVLPDEEDVHMAIEAELFRRVGAPAELLHTARSRNDQVALLLRLYVREQCALIVDALAGHIEMLTARAKTDLAIVLPAYTHRQRAQPIRLAFFWLGHAAALSRDVDAFRFVQHQADAMPLGVGAISGTSLPIDRDHVRRALRFERLTLNGLDTVGDRDFALDFAYAAARMLVHTSRLATDMVDFASAEFGFVRLDGAIACGSSMMPQKRNPDVFELVRAKAGSQVGDLVALLTTIKGLPSGYNRDMQEDRVPLLATGARARAVLSALAVALPRVTFDAERCAAAIADDATQATDIAEALVLAGVPFRVAYRLVGALVQQCKDEHTPLAKVTFEQAQRVDPRFSPEVLTAARPDGSIDRKVSIGSTGPAALAAQMDALTAVAIQARAAADKMPRLDALLASLTG